MNKKILLKGVFIVFILLAHAFYMEAQPASPVITPYVVACGSTTFNINAVAPVPATQQIRWYNNFYMQTLLYTGATYTGTATQSQTFYASTYDPGTGLQSPYPATAYVFVPKAPVIHAVAGADPVTSCLGAINVTVDTAIDSVTTVPIADSYVMLSTPGTNYGTLPYMIIWAGLYHTDDSARLYMKFDLTQIPPSVAVVDSRLTMTIEDGFAHGNNGNIYSHFVSNDNWSENTIDWTNKPSCLPFNIGWTGGNMGLPVVNSDTINYMYWVWDDDYDFDYGGETNYSVETYTNGVNGNVFSGLSGLGVTDTGILGVTQSEYAGDKILSIALESPGYDTRWRTKEYTCGETTIPHLKVYFAYNAMNSTFSWTGPNGYTSTEQNPTGLQQGTYTLTVTNAYGCTATTQVNVTNAVVTNPPDTATICSGTSYSFYGHDYNTGGIYSDTLTSSVGCDSIVSIALNITPPIQAAEYDSICIGSSYTFNGNTYTTAGAYTNDFTTASGCDSIVTVNVYIRPADPAPQVTSPVYYCQDSAAAPLSINGTAPIYWYDAQQGGTALPTAPIPVTTTPGDFSWYVSDTGPEGCETQRAEITAHVYPTTDTPVAASPSYCKYANAIQLQASGTDILWYTQAQGGVPSSIAPVPATSTPGDEYYYVTQTINGCESPRATVAVQILPPPAPPTPVVDLYCQNEVPQGLNINGQNLLWYLTDSGGEGSTAFPSVAQLSAKTAFYVSQTVNGCESDRAPVYVEPCCTLELPTAFSPNGDGLNDVFRIITNGEYLIERFSVYDRWGGEIYVGTGNSAKWDGTIAGKPADIGDYYYYIIYTCGASGQLSKKGEVTLVR
jgi:gliding motility-associated-like protein